MSAITWGARWPIGRRPFPRLAIIDLSEPNPRQPRLISDLARSPQVECTTKVPVQLTRVRPPIETGFAKAQGRPPRAGATSDTHLLGDGLELAQQTLD